MMTFLFWSLCAVLSWGESCPVVSGSTNFNAAQYMGKWYIMSSPTSRYSRAYTSRCSWVVEESLSNGIFDNRKSSIKSSTNVRSETISKTAIVGPGEWSMSYWSTPSTTDEPNVYVLDTDNTEYSYLWYCYNMPGTSDHIAYLWIMNRDYDRTTDYIRQQEENAFAVLENFGFSSVSISNLNDSLSETDHTNCDYGDDSQ